jgi:hypothetical protein
VVRDRGNGDAEQLARSIHTVVAAGGDLEAVIRRLLALDPSPDLLLAAARWSDGQDTLDGTWAAVSSGLASAHGLGPFQPHPVGD